jgi:hypothetical protein
MKTVEWCLIAFVSAFLIGWFFIYANDPVTIAETDAWFAQRDAEQAAQQAKEEKEREHYARLDYLEKKMWRDTERMTQDECTELRKGAPDTPFLPLCGSWSDIKKQMEPSEDEEAIARRNWQLYGDRHFR